MQGFNIQASSLVLRTCTYKSSHAHNFEVNFTRDKKKSAVCVIQSSLMFNIHLVWYMLVVDMNFDVFLRLKSSVLKSAN